MTGRKGKEIREGDGDDKKGLIRTHERDGGWESQCPRLSSADLRGRYERWAMPRGGVSAQRVLLDIAQATTSKPPPRMQTRYTSRGSRELAKDLECGVQKGLPPGVYCPAASCNNHPSGGPFSFVPLPSCIVSPAHNKPRILTTTTPPNAKLLVSTQECIHAAIHPPRPLRRARRAFHSPPSSPRISGPTRLQRRSNLPAQFPSLTPVPSAVQATSSDRHISR